MKKYTERCSGQVGITYSHDNGKIISFQDNFKFLEDVLFALYFDFETTSPDNLCRESKMYAISYCQIICFIHYLDLKNCGFPRFSAVN